jgi:parallel beta-helix repeat protein
LTIAAILISSTMLAVSVSLISIVPDKGVDGDPTPVRTLTLIAHDPIYIDGNGGFTGPNATTGVTRGSGTDSDPYVIEGWEISSFPSNGINITNVDVHFVIQDCSVHDGAGARSAGIRLVSCSNGTIRSCNCSNSWYGIGLLNSGHHLLISSSNSLIGNNCSNNPYCGIYLYASRNNSLYNNTCWKNQMGVSLYDSGHNTLIGNDCSLNTFGGVTISQSPDIILKQNTLNDDGISIDGNELSHWNTHVIDVSNKVNGKPVLYYSNQSGTIVPDEAGQIIVANCSDFIIEDHDLSHTTVGIILAYSSNTLIVNNTCSNDSYGIRLYASSDNTLMDNNCSGDGYGISVGGRYVGIMDGNTLIGNNCSNAQYYGIYVYCSSGNSLVNNTCSNNTHGIGLYLSYSNSLIGNNCSSNSERGIWLWSANGNTLTCNQLCYNQQYGIYITSIYTNSNRFWNNIFYHNNGAGDTFDLTHCQAYDDGDNLWNSMDGYGNYWSDWTTPDNDSNGIVDLPYEIDGSAGAKDNYPRTTVPSEPIPEFGMMSLVVIALLVAVMLGGEAGRGKAH